MKMMFVRYHYIGPEDYMTPLMYLPWQETNLDVVSPYGETQIKEALMRDYPGFFERMIDFHLDKKKMGWKNESHDGS